MDVVVVLVVVIGRLWTRQELIKFWKVRVAGYG